MDTRVQLSFELGKADWIPEDVRAKMMVIHRNKIDKKGMLTVSVQESSTQSVNYSLALERIQELISQAEQGVEEDKFQENKLEFKDWVVQKKIKEGREKEIEKRAEGIKEQKHRSRERGREKQNLRK